MAVSGYVVDGVHRCVVCAQRLFYEPETRDVCEGCRVLRGDPTPVPIVYHPRSGKPCPDCGAVLDAGMRLHPDCEAARVRAAAAEQKAREDQGTKAQKPRRKR